MVSGAVKSLRAYYKNRGRLEDIEAFRREAQGQSDRATVLLLATAIDNALSYRIAVSMKPIPQTPAEFENAFRFEGPLGTFSSRIEIAFLFGIIEPATRRQLDDFRELRNACAHSMREMSFSVPEVAAIARRLFHPGGAYPLLSDTPEGIRGAFFAETAFIYHALFLGSRETALQALHDAGAGPPSPDKHPTP